MTSIAELLDRVRRSEGPDRELDLHLGKLEFGFETDEDGRPYVRYASPGGWEPLPHYTASVDAALSLVERKLPGRWWDILDAATAAMWRNEADVTFAGSRIRLDRLPLALLAALLSALSNEVNHDDR